MRRETLGDRHEDTLQSVNDLGALLYHQGKYDEAEPLYREALQEAVRHSATAEYPQLDRQSRPAAEGSGQV